MEKFILKNGEINAIKYDGSEKSKNEIKKASYGYRCNEMKGSVAYGNIFLTTHDMYNYIIEIGDYCILNGKNKIIYSMDKKAFEKIFKKNHKI